jgi:hypothetical protein
MVGVYVGAGDHILKEEAEKGKGKACSFYNNPLVKTTRGSYENHFNVFQGNTPNDPHTSH